MLPEYFWWWIAVDVCAFIRSDSSLYPTGIRTDIWFGDCTGPANACRPISNSGLGAESGHNKHQRPSRNWEKWRRSLLRPLSWQRGLQQISSWIYISSSIVQCGPKSEHWCRGANAKWLTSGLISTLGIVDLRLTHQCLSFCLQIQLILASPFRGRQVRLG